MRFNRITAWGVFLAMVALPGLSGLAGAQERVINGAGATFPYPVYSKWAYTYHQKTGVKLNYQSIGSGGGIAQIKARTVDFGASDAPLTQDELKAAGLIQWPMIIGGVVPVVNLAGFKPGELRLSGQTLADIYLGKIKTWDDPAIRADNPGKKLPGAAITVVHRADGSGTTWIFTNYLDKVSPEWHGKVGTNTAVAWPIGVGGKGNEGVAAYVQRIKGSIGYVELAYALQNKMVSLELRNKAGKYVSPSLDNFMAAAANADWANAPGMYMVLTDQPGDSSWPITGASFILFHRAQANPATAKEVLKFLDWAYKNGQAMATSLDYVPIPDNVVKLVEARWGSEIRNSGGKPVWP
jgi:phosphate transport system substrate-binding protein